MFTAKLMLGTVELIITQAVITGYTGGGTGIAATQNCREEGGGGGSSVECHERSRSGYRHDTGSYTESLGVRDLAACSDQCSRRTYCRGFSYRYSWAGYVNTKNCLLSNIDRPQSRVSP